MSLRGHHKAISNQTERISYLVVRIGEIYLALPADGVRGVLTREEAGTGDSVKAVGITYRQIDLTGFVMTETDFSTPESRTVLYSNSRSHGAIRVEEVFGLTDVEPEHCLPLPPQFRSNERTWFAGMIHHRTSLALIVNPSWLLGEIAEVVSLVENGAPC
jgi:chemotaxis signal transduction protein